MMKGKRVVFVAPNQVELETFEDNGALAPTEVLIQARLTLISPGTELARLHGFPKPGTSQPRAYPTTRTGYSHVGAVIAAGAKATVQPGQRVFSMSVHTSLARIDTAREVCIPIPDGISNERAVFTRLAVVPMTAAQLTPARAGDHVAVIGLGPIGNLSAQVFQLCGCAVNAFELSPTRRAVASRCGANSAHPSDAIPSFGSIHRAVIEATGSTNVLPLCLDLVCDRGEIVMIGAPWGKGSEGFPINHFAGALFSRFVTLRSGWESELPLMGTDPALHSVERNCATALRWLAQSKLVVDPLITHRLRPDQIMVGYAGLEKHKEEFIGVLLDWSME